MCISRLLAHHPLLMTMPLLSMKKWCHTYLWRSHVTDITKESCHTYLWGSHVTHIYNTTPHTCDMTPLYVTHIYERVMSHICMKESCHTYLWESHVTHICDTSRHTYLWHDSSYVWHDSFISHTYLWRSHVTHMYEGVMSHISITRLLIRVTWLLYMRVMCLTILLAHHPSLMTMPLWRMKKSCHICEGVMSHIWTSHVTHMKESCHRYVSHDSIIDDDASLTNEGVLSRMWRWHVTHMKKSCHVCGDDTSPQWSSHVTYMTMTCHHISPQWRSHVTKMCDMSHSLMTTLFPQMTESCHTYVEVMSQICATWVIHWWRRFFDEWRSHVTYVKESCYTYVWHESSIDDDALSTNYGVLSHMWRSHVT